MAISDWFVFKSKKQRDKERKEYEHRMFPLGMKEEREWELNMLRELYPEKKKDITDYLFCLLILRDDLYNTQLEPDDGEYMSFDAVINKWQKNKLVKEFGRKADLRLIQSMAILENAATSLDTLPTAERIRAAAEAN